MYLQKSLWYSFLLQTGNELHMKYRHSNQNLIKSLHTFNTDDTVSDKPLDAVMIAFILFTVFITRAIGVTVGCSAWYCSAYCFVAAILLFWWWGLPDHQLHFSSLSASAQITLPSIRCLKFNDLPNIRNRNALLLLLLLLMMMLLLLIIMLFLQYFISLSF